MTIQIKVRDNNGKFCDAIPGEFARAAFDTCLDMDHGDGWTWFRGWLCRVLIKRSEINAGNPTVADKWYRRYQALREIG